MNNHRTIVAVEIGSSKIKGAVGEVSPDGILTVKHIEEERQSPNFVRYGSVQNVKEVANVLNRIVMKLNNRISPAKISAVYAGVGGRSMMSIRRHVETTLPDDTEITPEIVSEILGRAENIPNPDRQVVETVLGEFKVDNMKVNRPVGTIGSAVSAEVEVISCRQQILRNLSLAISEKLGLKINGYVVRQTAMADMVLSEEEKELGVMLADCGAETTTVSIYKGGFLISMVTIPLGSRHITRDIMSRNYSEERAEELKRAIGNALPDSKEERQHRAEGIENSTEINNYVAARAGEIAVNILERINEAGLSPQDLPEGIVVAGGGSQLAGFLELLIEQSGLPVRRATIPSSVRSGSLKLHLGNEIDVVSLLHHLAAEPDTHQCTMVPVEEKPAAPETPEDEDQENYIEEKVGGRTSRLSRIFIEKIREIINPTDDEGDMGFDDEE